MISAGNPALLRPEQPPIGVVGEHASGSRRSSGLFETRFEEFTWPGTGATVTTRPPRRAPLSAAGVISRPHTL
jgi:hypothetical protein